MNNKTELDALREAILAGDSATAVNEARRLLEEHIDPEEIVTDGVEKAMEQLDAKCTVEQFNLLEIMLSGRAVTGVMQTLFPACAPVSTTRGTVVIASLEGDVHDLGKNIVGTVLKAKGYRVVDCGKDCPIDRLLDAAEREAAVAVGISGLITSIIPQVRKVRDRLYSRGLTDTRVVVGGAALKQATPKQLNADFVGATAFDCLHYLDELTGGD